MALESQGSKIKYGGVDIGEAITISGPSGSAPVIDISHLKSDAAEKLLGLLDEGQIAIEANYIASDAGQVKCKEKRLARESTSAVIYLGSSTGPTVTCKAFCSGFSLNKGVNQAIRANITLEITGAATYTT